MRTHLLFLSVGLVACTSAPTRRTATLPPPALSAEYAGVYTSTPDEDYFVPCGVEGFGDPVSLRFRDNEPRAAFIGKASAIRGLPPLTHFIRVRGKLGPRGSYNRGFQTRELWVDSLLDVNETLEPCAGFGVPAAWERMSARFVNSKGSATTNDLRLVALMDMDGRVSLWSSETGRLVANLGTVTKGDLSAGGYGPMTFSDDGNLLAVGGQDRIVRVWRTRDGKKVFSLALKDRASVMREIAKIPPRADAPGYRPAPPPTWYEAPRQIAFNKRGTMLVTTNLFSTIVWSMQTGQKLAEFPLGTDFRRKAFFVGDQGLLITADSGRMTLRSTIDAQPIIPSGTRAEETDVAELSRDGRTIAVGTWSDSVFLWSVTGGPGRVVHVPGFASGVTAFSPDGNIVAFGGSELYLYDVRTGAPIKAFHNFPGPLFGVWFSPDAKSIVTLSVFDDRFRIVYLEPSARPATQPIFDDSASAKLPLGPPTSMSPRTVGGIVSGPKQRAVADAEVTISNGDAPDSVVARTTTSSGGYFSFNGIRFRHVLIRVRKPGFAPASRSIHLTRWPDDGPWGIELTPDARPESGGD
jgi:WD40 repeat protein